MTRQEAVWHAKHVFNIVIERCFNAQNLKDAREFDEAKQIVIEALEQEPKRGKWVKTYPHMLSVEEQRFYGAKDPKEPMPDKRFSVTVCSLCGATHPIDGDNFCPNCGARMESDEE